MKQITDYNNSYNIFKDYMNQENIKKKLSKIDNYIDVLFKEIGLKKDDLDSAFYMKNIVFYDIKKINDIINILNNRDEWKNKTKTENSSYYNLREACKTLYKHFSDKDTGISYEIIKELHIRACPYCNLNYIDPIYKDKAKILRHHLDHYYPISEFPFFCVSFFNLIPSCYECNSGLKHDTIDKIPVNPYENDLDNMSEFTLNFKTFVEHPLAISDTNSFEINFMPTNEIYKNQVEQHDDLLKINTRYSYRKDYVRELYLKKLVLRGKLKEEILQRLSCLDPNIDENLILWGNYMNSEAINTRPLAKLTKDINNYFKSLGI